MKFRTKNYNYNKEAVRKDFELVESIARTMDNRYAIPGTGLRFGWDPILNFFPVVGEIITFIISMCLVLIMWKHDVSPKALIKMTLNVLADAILGGIPLIGKIFDFTFKANERNVKLLKSHYMEGKHNGSGIGILLVILSIFFLFFFAVLFLLWKITEWVWNGLAGLFS